MPSRLLCVHPLLVPTYYGNGIYRAGKAAFRKRVSGVFAIGVAQNPLGRFAVFDDVHTSCLSMR